MAMMGETAVFGVQMGCTELFRRLGAVRRRNLLLGARNSALFIL